MTQIPADQHRQGPARRRRVPRPASARVLAAADTQRLAGSVAALARQAAALGHALACQRENPQLWFSDLPADLDRAKAHCQQCPLRGPCLTGAIERREQYGVWGGEIFDHGRIIARKIARGRPRKGARTAHEPEVAMVNC
jgi:WhiB family redox-sensing transcriptional regulator